MRRLICSLMAVTAALLFSMEAMAAKLDMKMSIDEVELQVAPDLKYKVFGFNGQVPGPLIHVKEGDEVTVHVTNNTTLPHTVHWHGLYQHNNWQGDGVPGITQAKGIQPGTTYDYHWVAEKP
ncbi:MAG: multicopper oxidase domain-containing protein, partial [Mariprofundales bacterium]